MKDPIRELRMVWVCMRNSIYNVVFSSDERIELGEEEQ